MYVYHFSVLCHDWIVMFFCMVCKIMKYRYCIVQYAAMISISLVTFCFSIFLCYDAKCLIPIFSNGFSLLILYIYGFYLHIVGIVWQRYVFLFRLPNCFVVFSNNQSVRQGHGDGGVLAYINVFSSFGRLRITLSILMNEIVCRSV